MHIRALTHHMNGAVRPPSAEESPPRRRRAKAAKKVASAKRPRSATPKSGRQTSSAEVVEPAQPVRVVVVDDHRFMRELISTMLARHSGRYKVVAEHGDARTAILACEEHSPDLLILDINLPDFSGIDAVPQIKKVAPQTRVLLCTAFVSDERVIDALRSGADGFVEKTNTWSDFVEAIDRVSNGEHFFRSQSSPALCEAVGRVKAGPPGTTSVPLSQREKEILTLIAHGNTSKEIATKLCVSVGTVETHRCHVLRKLHLRNVAELVVYAFRVGLIKLPSQE